MSTPDGPDHSFIWDEMDELIWNAMAVATARRLIADMPCSTCVNESYLTGWFREAIAAAVITDRQNREEQQQKG